MVQNLCRRRSEIYTPIHLLASKLSLQYVAGFLQCVQYQDVTPTVLFHISVITSMQHVCYLYEENKSDSSVNELRYS